MTAVVIDFAAFRSRRAKQAVEREAAKADVIARAQPQARACPLAPLEPPVEEPPEPVEPEPEPIRWRTSSSGNPWARVGGLHIVIFPDRGNTDEWLVLVQRGERRRRYLKHVWPSAEAAEEAVERSLKWNGGTAELCFEPGETG